FTVPGNAPAAVYVNDGQAIGGHIFWLRALARGIYSGVFHDQDGICYFIARSLRCDFSLIIPGFLIIHQAQTPNLYRLGGGTDRTVSRKKRVARSSHGVQV